MTQVPAVPAPYRGRLHIDFETRSPVDLTKTGVHRYATDPRTEVLMACWAIDDGPIFTWFPSEPCPPEIKEHILSGGVVVAHNAGFEWHIIQFICAPRHGWPTVDPRLLDCTAARAAIQALPRALGQLASALGLPAEKDQDGRRLMLQMCKPRRVNPDGTFEWWDDADRMQRLEKYCRKDLEVERLADKRLAKMTPAEREVWLLDFRMNAIGVCVDLPLVKRAGLLLEGSMDAYRAELTRLTGGYVQDVTEVAALKTWVGRQGYNMESLDKRAVRELLADQTIDSDVRRVLEIRQEAGKSSTAKLLAFAGRTSKDGRMRENLMYHGASTGRWAGRGVQLQNLPRPELKKDDVASAIEVIRDRESEQRDKITAIECLFGPVPTVIADALRGCIISPPGSVLYVSDFANIEGRVLAWVAGQDDLVKLFRENGKVYESMAAAIFGMPVGDISKEGKERQLGKKAVLGCGFQMGWERFQESCAEDGIAVSEEMAKRTVETYREVNDKIVAFWYGIEEAAVAAVATPGTVFGFRGARFLSRNGWLRCRLPSDRELWYYDPRIEMVKTPWGKFKQQVSFMGVDSFTKKWCRQRTYGGSLTENIVQALARDLLAAAMLRINRNLGTYGEVVLSIHDEVIAEVSEQGDSLLGIARFEAWMSEVPAWAEGCPVKAEGGFVSKRYRK